MLHLFFQTKLNFSDVLHPNKQIWLIRSLPLATHMLIAQIGHPQLPPLATGADVEHWLSSPWEQTWHRLWGSPTWASVTKRPGRDRQRNTTNSLRSCWLLVATNYKTVHRNIKMLGEGRLRSWGNRWWETGCALQNTKFSLMEFPSIKHTLPNSWECPQISVDPWRCTAKYPLSMSPDVSSICLVIVLSERGTSAISG